MSDVPISLLPPSGPMGTSDVLAGVQNGVTKKFDRASLGLARSGANTDITGLSLGTAFSDLLYGSPYGMMSGGNLLMAPFGTNHPQPTMADRGIAISRVRPEYQLYGSGAGSGSGAIFRGAMCTGSVASPAATARYQGVGMSFAGYVNGAWTQSQGRIVIEAGLDWTTGSTPSSIYFETTPVGSTTMVQRWGIGPAGNLAPSVDNVVSLGNSANRPNVLWAVSGTISTSDAREKTPVRQMSEAELSVAKALVREIGFYKFLTAVAEKGEEARDHCGMTVQRAIELFEDAGLDPFSYSFICHDDWEAEGDRSAGDRYSFREGGLMMFMLAGVNARLEALEI